MLFRFKRRYVIRWQGMTWQIWGFTRHAAVHVWYERAGFYEGGKLDRPRRISDLVPVAPDSVWPKE